DGTLKSTGQLFDEAAASIAGIDNATERAGIANALFGQSYVKLIPLLNEGGEGLAQLRGEVEELGVAFDEAFLENAQKFNDNFDRMKLGLKGIAIQAIGPLLPRMISFATQAFETVKAISAW